MKFTPKPKGKIDASDKPQMISVLKPYKWLLLWVVLITLVTNGLNLVIPKIIQNAIDSFDKGNFNLPFILLTFSGAVVFIFVFNYAQRILQVFISEKVARELRQKIVDKIAGQSYRFIQDSDPNRLLTNLTSDVDAVKTFVAQAVVNIISSGILVIGAAVLLIRINWELGISVLLIVPFIAVAFLIVFKKIKKLFKKSQQILDRLNKVINESILGAPIIRVLNAQMEEENKFIIQSGASRDLGIAILRLFATIIPIISFISNLALLVVLGLGGYFVISDNMTIGELAAFNSYIAIMIFPILVIGFMSNVIARASASYARIFKVLNAEDIKIGGTVAKELTGHIEVQHLNLTFGDKRALKDVSFEVKPHSKTAIIGPTAAGKTQLLNCLTTLISPQSGVIRFDEIRLTELDQQSLLSQVGLVFQDAIIFNLSLRENIAFNQKVSPEALNKAIETAEIGDLIEGLPNGLDSIISERGGSLSGGQKQRVMLARALAIEPRILLLDEFTARVDRKTEQKIVSNLFKNYPGITLLSITQNISSVVDFDQIILLMEGEIVAMGTHNQLINSSPEYVQIFRSQQSVNNYDESTGITAKGLTNEDVQ